MPTFLRACAAAGFLRRKRKLSETDPVHQCRQQLRRKCFVVPGAPYQLFSCKQLNSSFDVGGGGGVCADNLTSEAKLRQWRRRLSLGPGSPGSKPQAGCPGRARKKGALRKFTQKRHDFYPPPPEQRTAVARNKQLVGRTVDVEATRQLEAEMDIAADNGSGGSPARAGGGGAAGKGKSPSSPTGRANGQHQRRGSSGGKGIDASAAAAPVAGVEGGAGGGANGNGGEVSEYFWNFLVLLWSQRDHDSRRRGDQ